MGKLELIVVGLVGAILLDRLLLWAEARDWINYRFENMEERDDSGDPPVLGDDEQ